MAFDVAQLFDEITQVMADTWPATAPGASGGGIWEINQVARRSFEEIGGFPYGVVEIPPTEDADWGLTNASQEASLSQHYLTREDADMTEVWAALEDLKSAMFAATFTGMTVLRLQSEDWSAQHPANALFLSKKVPYVAGSIVMRVVYGESAL
jgi:hypothetical protein